MFCKESFLRVLSILGALAYGLLSGYAILCAVGLLLYLLDCLISLC